MWKIRLVMNRRAVSLSGQLAWLTLLVVMPTGLLRADTYQPLTLTMGVYQSDKATTMHKKFKPVLNYLGVYLTQRLKRPVALRLRIYKEYQEANDALVNGEIDFSRFGPASYVQAKARNPGISLLAMEQRKGKNYFYGAIIVPADSLVWQLAQLKGRRFAFGNQRSTIGRYLAQHVLIEAGVYASDLKVIDYLGRHDKVFKVVALGKYDAGALKETTVSRYNQAGEVRIIHRFKNMTKPWIARAGLAPEILSGLSNGLRLLTNATLLKELKVSGFMNATDKDYEVTREGMRLAEGFLQQ